MNKKIIFTLSALFALGGLSSCGNKTTVKSLSVLCREGVYEYYIGQTIQDIDFDVTCDLSNGEHKLLSKDDYKLEGNTLPHIVTKEDVKKGYVEFTFKYEDKKFTKRIQAHSLFRTNNVKYGINDYSGLFLNPAYSLSSDYKFGIEDKKQIFSFYAYETYKGRVIGVDSKKAIGDSGTLYIYKEVEGVKQIIDECTIKVIDDSGLSFDNIGDVKIEEGTEITNLNIPTYHNAWPVSDFAERGIDKGAFEETQIESIELNDFIGDIPSNTFKNCTKLESVKLGKVAQSYNNIIKSDAFFGCDSLRSIDIPDNYSVIESDAFNGCRNLEKIGFTNNSNLIYVGQGAFSGCNKTTITKDYCEYLNAYVDGVKVPCAVLLNVDNATKDFKVDDRTKIISCHSTKSNFIETLTIPSGVEVIAPYSFAYKTNLKEIKFEDNSLMYYIGDSAFNGCIGLTSLNIPQYVSVIGKNAFCSTSLSTAKFDNLYGWYYYQTEPTEEYKEIAVEELKDEKLTAQLITRTHSEDPIGYCDFYWFCD